MQQDILVSVIVPVYNVEEYLGRCVESILNQTYRNLEVILVDDGAKDSSGRICDQYAAQDHRVKVIHKENGGLSSARNAGMGAAQGKYIWFIDSDDWIELDAYEKLYEQTKEKRYHKVSGSFIRESYPGQKNLLIEQGETGSICTGIYLKQIILENNIWFPEGVAYEDNYFGAILKLYATDVCEIDDIIYHYYVNPNSTVTSRGEAHHFDRLDIEIAIVEEYKVRGVFELYKEELEAQFVQKFYLNSLYIFFTRFEEIPRVVEDMRKMVWNYFPNFRENVYFDTCNKREKALLQLLDVKRELTLEEWYRIKLAYLKTF